MNPGLGGGARLPSEGEASLHVNSKAGICFMVTIHGGQVTKAFAP